eukprot:scaffold32329_cov54-Phaeocystis_antarctica.AAC.1
MRPLRAVGCENGGQGEGKPPGSGAVLRFTGIPHLPQGTRQRFRICNSYRFPPLFVDFGGPTPLECPHSRPPPVQTAAETK